MNRFFETHGDVPSEVPRRAYARLDSVEEERAFFELIDADFADEAGLGKGGAERWQKLAPEAPLGVLEAEVTIKRDEAGRIHRIFFRCEEGGLQGLQLDNPHPWFEFQLSEGGETATFYPGLFAEGQMIALRDIDQLAAELRAGLDRSFALSHLVVDEGRIRKELSKVARGGAIEWVAVYDVGQGSANGICRQDGQPLAYFDLGGGVLANKDTFDSRFTNICDRTQPPVILSHWDWDHWSGGMRFPTSQHLNWIAPLQALGAVHSAFAAGLAANGRLLIWPPSLSEISEGQLCVRKCTGRGRNHSGLAIEVHGPNGEEPILLSGDARYNVIPGALSRNYQAVVVPHHGANMRNASVPEPAGTIHARAGYSCGSRNTFCHPRKEARSSHDAAGWKHDMTHPGTHSERRTDLLRDLNKLGHFGLGWSGQTGMVHLPCFAHCTLDFEAT